MEGSNGNDHAHLCKWLHRKPIFRAVYLPFYKLFSRLTLDLTALTATPHIGTEDVCRYTLKKSARKRVEYFHNQLTAKISLNATLNFLHIKC